MQAFSFYTKLHVKEQGKNQPESRTIGTDVVEQAQHKGQNCFPVEELQNESAGFWLQR